MRVGSLVRGIALATAAFCSSAYAGDITYDIDQTIGAGGVTGNIVTDGTIGALSSANLVSWNLLLNDGTTTFTFTDSGLFDATLTATATQLLFDFSGGIDILRFVVPFTPMNLCFQSAPNTCAFVGTGEELAITTEQFTPLSGTQVIGAIASPAPEPSSLVLLAAGIALIGLSSIRSVRYPARA